MPSPDRSGAQALIQLLSALRCLSFRSRRIIVRHPHGLLGGMGGAPVRVRSIGSAHARTLLAKIGARPQMTMICFAPGILMISCGSLSARF